MVEISEKDWKIFKVIREKAIESYCKRCLSNFQEVISSSSGSSHEKYLKNYEMVQDLDHKMERIFIHLARSKVVMELIQIRKEGLADQSLVSELSQELQDQTDPENRKW